MWLSRQCGSCSSPWLQCEGRGKKCVPFSSAGRAGGAFCFPCGGLRSPAAVVSPGALCHHLQPSVYPSDWMSKLRTPAGFLSGITSVIYKPLSHSVLSLLLPSGVIHGWSVTPRTTGWSEGPCLPVRETLFIYLQGWILQREVSFILVVKAAAEFPLAWAVVLYQSQGKAMSTD